GSLKRMQIGDFEVTYFRSPSGGMQRSVIRYVPEHERAPEEETPEDQQQATRSQAPSPTEQMANDGHDVQKRQAVFADQASEPSSQQPPSSASSDSPPTGGRGPSAGSSEGGGSDDAGGLAGGGQLAQARQAQTDRLQAVASPPL